MMKMNKRQRKKQRKKLLERYLNALSLHRGIPIDKIQGVVMGIRTE